MSTCLACLLPNYPLSNCCVASKCWRTCTRVSCSGLVSGHVLAELVRAQHGAMAWYRGELLNMAVDCANRLLPAFNSSTGNLLYNLELHYNTTCNNNNYNSNTY